MSETIWSFDDTDEALAKFAKDFQKHGQATIVFLRSYSMAQRQSVRTDYLEAEWRHFKSVFLGRAMAVLPPGDTVIRTTETELEKYGGILTRTITLYALTPENWDLLRYSEMKPIKSQVDEL